MNVLHPYPHNRFQRIAQNCYLFTSDPNYCLLHNNLTLLKAIPGKRNTKKLISKQKQKVKQKRRRTGILFRTIPVETSYLIIIPSLIGDRVVSEAIHFDVAIDVQLLIAQLLIAWNGIVVGEAASRIVTLFLTLGLGCGSHRSTAR